MRFQAVLASLCLIALAPTAFPQQHSDMPAGMSHAEHMKQRANAAMGFDQDKTTHHFLLKPDGGIISVEVNDAADAVNKGQIRQHLQTIAREFAEGKFASPLATHAELPAGVPVMTARKSRIAYTWAETLQGAQVTIATKDKAARKAVHDFIRYQIREHKTGDPVTLAR